MTDREKVLRINQLMADSGVSRDAKREIPGGQATQWQLSPRPLAIGPCLERELMTLGHTLYRFYQAANKLYFASVRGEMPPWVAQYLEQGKPPAIVELGRTARFRNQLPMVIRPDLFVSRGRLVATELDSVPGGMGLLGSLSQAYGSLGEQLLGGASGIVQGFGDAMRALAEDNSISMAVVVSEECRDYFLEMVWLAKELRELGHRIWVVRPEQVEHQSDGVGIRHDGQLIAINAIYRFFEMFDLDNVAGLPDMLTAARKRVVRITPPFKTFLEEKMLFALYHHPSLRDWWLDQLPAAEIKRLDDLFPRTWILDPSPLPPHAIIPGLRINNSSAQRFEQLLDLPKNDRQFVIKPSGFSELAWGSRGVRLLFEQSNEELKNALTLASESFARTPYLVQEYHRSDKVTFSRYSFVSDEIKEMVGRTRLCPFYLMGIKGPALAGILATICPVDKPLIHGMTDAVMVPVTVSDQFDLEIN